MKTQWSLLLASYLFIQSLCAQAEDLRDLSVAMAPYSKQAYCELVSTPEKVQRRAFNAQERLGLVNGGGLLGSGVCWWHSQFQRAALFLTYLRPDLPKPSLLKAFQIVSS